MGAIIIPDKNPKTFAKRKFFETHFSADYQKQGFVSVELNCKNHRKMKHLWSYETDASFVDKILKITCSRKCNYYITANSFKSPKRSGEELFQLKNIVIDIDAHGKDTAEFRRIRSKGIETISSMILSGGLEYYDIPVPNSVICTGRGLQLWYAIEDASYKLLDVYKSTASSLCDAYDDMLTSMPLPSEMFSVDRQASCNASGLFRFPGSFNLYAGSFGNIYTLIDYKYNLLELNRYFKDSKNEDSFVCKKDSASSNTYASNPLPALKRVEAIKNLIMIRQESSCCKDEMRDIVLFLCYCCLCDYLSEEDIDKIIVEINDMFQTPLKEKEWKAYLSTAKRKHYHVSNNKIIESLAITVEEQKLIGLTYSKRASGKNQRTDKNTRNKQIIELAAKGFSKKEIAKQSGCSPQTVARVLEANNIKTDAEKRKNRALSKALKGMCVEKLMSIFGYSKTQAREIFKAAREIMSVKKEKLNVILKKAEEYISAKKNEREAIAKDVIKYLESDVKGHDNYAIQQIRKIPNLLYIIGIYSYGPPETLFQTD